MANIGFLVPRPSQCPDCRGGRIGMDDCDRCAGTGTVFHINGKYFPDTAQGYKAAEAELVNDTLSGTGNFCCG
jgi:hypothetical protein